MKRWAFLAVLILLTACAGIPEREQILELCLAHDAAVRTFAPFVAQRIPSQSQVSAVDRSIIVADEICDGTATDYGTALRRLRGELLRMSMIQTQVGGS